MLHFAREIPNAIELERTLRALMHMGREPIDCLDFNLARKLLLRAIVLIDAHQGSRVASLLGLV